MNWLEKLAGKIRLKDINEHVILAIRHIVSDNITFTNPRMLMAPAKLQQYGTVAFAHSLRCRI
jgi:hypothetical protein